MGVESQLGIVGPELHQWQDRGLSGDPSHDWTVQAFQERPRVLRGPGFLEGGRGCAPANPTPGRKGPVCSQQWAT